MSLKIVIADDHEVVRSGLKSLLADTDIEVVGEATSAPEAVRAALALRPDVVILDVRMGETDGLSALAQIRQERPEMAVLILSTYDNPTYIARALALGASGYLLKRTASARLLQAIRDVHGGGSPMTPQLARRVVQYFARPADNESQMSRLTPGEKDFLDQLAKGYAYKEIADRMSISIDTVRSYVRTVYEKLHVHSRTEAVVKYLQS